MSAQHSVLCQTGNREIAIKPKIICFEFVQVASTKTPITGSTGDIIHPSDNQLLFFRRVKWAIMLWHSRTLDTVMHVSYSYSYIVTQLCGHLQLQLTQHHSYTVCQDQYSLLLIYILKDDWYEVWSALSRASCLLFMSTRLWWRLSWSSYLTSLYRRICKLWNLISSETYWLPSSPICEV